LLIVNFQESLEAYTLPLMYRLREAGVAVELYPAAVKLKKQMSYADSKGIPYVLLVGDEEAGSGQLSLKNMESGEQEKLTIDELIEKLK